METLKIALVSASGSPCPPTSYGGLEYGVYDLAYCLGKMGHEVTLIAPVGSRLENGKVMETIDSSLEIYDFQKNAVRAEFDASEFYIEKLSGFDIVHDHSWFGISYTAKHGNEKLKVCHTHHGHCNWNIKTVPAYAKPINFFSISEFIKRENELNGIVSKRVYNGTNLDKFGYVSHKENRLLFVGRLNTIKHPHAAMAAAIDSGIPIDVVGTLQFKEPGYQDCIQAWGQRSRGLVKFHININNDEKIRLIQKARAMIIPSRFEEPFGSVAVESMACGTPAIVMRDGALPEVVGEGPDAGGIVCETYKQLVESIKKAHKISPETCRKRAELFSREINAQNYLGYYKQILSGDEW